MNVRLSKAVACEPTHMKFYGIIMKKFGHLDI